jgi:hypothetical protein
VFHLQDGEWVFGTSEVIDWIAQDHKMPRLATCIWPESIKSAHKSQLIRYQCYTIDRKIKSPSCKSSAHTRYKNPTFFE